MPIYEYQCTKCREVCEVLQKAKDKPLDKCPHCGGAMVKRISSPAIQFKGSGWYVNDYAKKSSTSSGTKAGVQVRAEGRSESRDENRSEGRNESGAQSRVRRGRPGQARPAVQITGTPEVFATGESSP